MIERFPLLAVGACALALAGCSAKLNEARNAPPAETEFARALQSGYIKLAGAELDEIDFHDTDVFAGRALVLAEGGHVEPEPLEARVLPAEATPKLGRARARLVAALDRGARRHAPAPAAEAQLRFDCWMQEQEENFQFDHIAACRDGFLAALTAVEAVVPAKPHARVRPTEVRATPAAARTVKTADTARPPVTVTVTFAFDSAAIDGAGEAAVAKAIDAYKTFGTAIVRLAGHADRAGPEAYNMKLALARADAVSAAMQREGVPAGLIRIRAYGEARPAVATPDGAREGRNRRVEIAVDPQLPRTAIRQ